MGHTTSNISDRKVEKILAAAQDLGFVRAGIVSADRNPRAHEAWKQWVDEGFHGNMDYMARYDRRDEPRQVLEQVKSIIVVALPYPRRNDLCDVPTDEAEGYVARYARGKDYHGVFKERLWELAQRCSNILGRDIIARPCVDTAPLLERELAAKSGFGFIGKSSMFIIPGQGTNVLLGELLTDIELPNYEVSDGASGCGSCTKCLDDCPTNAFVGPYVLDARRCVSYLTIEHKDEIPRDLRAKMGAMIFGCDICQDVCPFNRSPQEKVYEPLFAAKAHLKSVDLPSLLNIGSAQYRKFVADTALRRASRAQLARNVAVALGNKRSERGLEALIEASNHLYPLVRGHVAWALGQYLDPRALATLEVMVDDDDLYVIDEARAALAGLMALMGQNNG